MTSELETLRKLSTGYKWVGRNRKLPDTPGLPPDASTEGNLRIIEHIFREIDPKDTLEIGLSRGISAALFCLLHKSAGHAPRQQHVALDPFQTSDFDEAGAKFVEDQGLGGYFQFITEFSSDALPRLLREGKRFDLMYIDGSHLFEDVFIDFFYSYNLLRKGGIMLFDDSSDKHVLKVCRFIEANYAEKLEPLAVADIKGLNGLNKAKYQLAVQLGKTQLRGYKKLAEEGQERRHWAAPLGNF